MVGLTFSLQEDMFLVFSPCIKPFYFYINPEFAK